MARIGHKFVTARGHASAPGKGYLHSPGGQSAGMDLKTDTVNGIVSLVISVAATYPFMDDEDDGYTGGELLLSVALAAFLSGFFTSFFAGE